MQKLWALGILMTLFAATVASAQATPATLSAAGTAKAQVRADVAVVFMVLRSSAGVAVDALAQNQKKQNDVKERLHAMGLADRVRFSSTRFGSPQPPYYGGPRPVVTGVDVSQYVYVLFEGDDLDAGKLEPKIAAVIDELTRAGASIVLDQPLPRVCPQSSCAVAYAVKDASKVTAHLAPQALAQAREYAERTAALLNVKLGSVRTINQNSSSQYYNGGTGGVLDDLPFEFYSATVDTVNVSVSIGLTYEIKSGS